MNFNIKGMTFVVMPISLCCEDLTEHAQRKNGKMGVKIVPFAQKDGEKCIIFYEKIIDY